LKTKSNKYQKQLYPPNIDSNYKVSKNATFEEKKNLNIVKKTSDLQMSLNPQNEKLEIPCM
jgi:hypothetical protein